MSAKSPAGWLDYFDHVGFNNHEDLERFATWLSLVGYSEDQVGGINTLAEAEQDHFLGEYGSPAEYVEEMLEGYSYELEALPQWIRDGIDVSEIWRKWVSYDCRDHDLPNGNVWIWHVH